MTSEALDRALSMRGIGKIPPGWKALPLKTFLRPRSERDEEELPLLSVYRDHGVVPFGSIEGNHNKPSLDLSTYKVVRAGDLVLNKMKTWQGSLAISGYEGLVSPAYVVCRVGGAWDKRYLHYLVRSPSYVAEYASLSYGVRVGQWDMRFEDFRDVLALQPPIEDQRRIADYLDTETARIDTLINRKQHFIDLLLEKRTALITHAVTKGLDPSVEMKDSGVEWIGDVPAYWEVGSLRRWWSVIDCKHRTVEPASEGIPMVSIGQVQNVRIDCSDARLAGPEDYRDLIEGGRDPRPGDVVYSRNASVGLVSLVNTAQPVCLGQDVCMLRSSDGLGSGLYLTHQLRSAVGVEQLRALQRGPTFNRINVGNIRAFIICQPPRHEQEAIASFVEGRLQEVDNLAAATRRSIDLLREYRTALISAAVTGQIDIPGTEAAEEVA